MLEIFLNVVPITIIVGIIYVIYRIIKIKKNNKLFKLNHYLLIW